MTDTIITSDTSSKSSDFSSGSRIICRVCEKQFSQYTCPRCNIRYCSLHCYKSHSLRCTESFMRENVMGEMEQMKPDEESKTKMLDILKRFHEEEETDSFHGDELDSSMSEETIQKILSGGQISFNDLSVEEKKHFQRAIASGELSKLIEPWDPWWLKPSAKYISLSSDGAQLVQPINNENSEASSENETDDDQSNDIPPGPESPLPSITKLTTSKPSPLLPVHLIDIIYSYCFTLRLYNGDWRSDPLESAMVVLNVSSVLGQGTQPETQTCSSYKHMGGSQFGLSIMDDVISLLYLGNAALICLLCDMQKLIRAAEGEVKYEKMQKSKRVELERKLRFAERKFTLLLWASLAATVSAEKSSVVEYSDCKRGNVKREAETGRRGKPLIEEIE
ncbi:hypothetical protein ACJIZ3_003786 [Penstemon smallii]|uniref:HIT-type domain-containing protein n=1 Tax=Penstemon smallii TaxID=265156 RepID=A0ABD3S093_9LAMI